MAHELDKVVEGNKGYAGRSATHYNDNHSEDSSNEEANANAPTNPDAAAATAALDQAVYLFLVVLI